MNNYDIPGITSPQQDQRGYFQDVILAVDMILVVREIALHRAKLMRHMTPTERGLFVASRGKRFFHDFLFIGGIPGMFILGVFADTSSNWLAGWLPVVWLITGCLIKLRWHLRFWASRKEAWDSYFRLRHGKSLVEVREWQESASQEDLFELKNFMEYWMEPVA